MRFPFPKDFLFGAACSACQIEAGCKEGIALSGTKM